MNRFMKIVFIIIVLFTTTFSIMNLQKINVNATSIVSVKNETPQIPQTPKNKLKTELEIEIKKLKVEIKKLMVENKNEKEIKEIEKQIKILEIELETLEIEEMEENQKNGEVNYIGIYTLFGFIIFIGIVWVVIWNRPFDPTSY